MVAGLVALGTAASFVIYVITWRVKYMRWMRRGFAISEDFALWHERRREYLDPLAAKLDELTKDERERFRSDLAYYLRWGDRILHRQVEWEKSAP